MSKETLEEAAEKYCLINNIPIDQMIVKNDRSCEFKTPITMFINGAKYQADKMYSEEEVIELLEYVRQNYYDTGTIWHSDSDVAYTSEELLKEFKKS